MTFNLNSTPQSGHSLIACIGTRDYAACRTVNSISQTGVSWTRQAQAQSSGSDQVSEIWLGSVSSGASSSMTIYFDGSAYGSGACNIVDICEYTAVLTSVIIKPGTSSGSGSTLNTGVTTATTGGQELWIGTGCTGATTHYSPSPSNFQELDGQVAGNGTISYLEYIPSNSSGNAQCSETLGVATGWVGCITAFQAVYKMVAKDDIYAGYSSKETTIPSSSDRGANVLVQVESNFDDWGKSAVIENMVIDGNSQSGIQSGTIGILLRDVYNCNIRNVTIQNCDVGIQIDISDGKWAESNRLEHIRMINVKRGVVFTNHGDAYDANFTVIDDVGISLDTNASNAIGIQVGDTTLSDTKLKLCASFIKANVWVFAADSKGMLVEGEIKNSLVNFEVEHPDGSGGIGIKIVTDENYAVYNNQSFMLTYGSVTNIDPGNYQNDIKTYQLGQ